jgi:hypothetical protein
MKHILLSLVALTAFATLQAAALPPETQSKIDARLKDIQSWARDPALVGAVKSQNASLTPDLAAMSQDKWKTASVLDPVVRALTKNAAAEFLKKKKDAAVAEAFVSDAKGLKVGFLGKTSSWSHAGNPKHDLPMTGKTWQGDLELDESTGLQQVQVSVPVLDGETPVGSLVVGFSLSKLDK